MFPLRERLSSLASLALLFSSPEGDHQASAQVQMGRRREARTVLFVTNTPGYGGSEKHLLELIGRLDGSSVRSIILCAYTDPYSERLETARYSNVRVRSERGLRSFGDWFRIFRDVRPDVIVFIYGTLIAIPGPAVLAARLAGVRKLYSIQHLIPPPVRSKVEGRPLRNVAHRAIGGWARACAYLCDKTICVSNAVRDGLVQDYRFPRNATITIHNGVSVREFTPVGNDRIAIRARLRIRPEELVLVCSARLSEEKGIDILLTAVSGLVLRGLVCKCVILGDGHLKETLLAQIRQLGLDSYVRLEGFQEDVRPYLHAGDIFALTSYQEGLPFAVLEAMACGLPCVVTRVGGNTEAVSHNVEGLVVSPGAVDEVVEAVSYLWTHPAERARMSRAARTKACETFDIERRMAEIERVIIG